MPDPGSQWFHIIMHTNGSWLPGDPRGFRSKQHRIHSSGDYKNPPPVGEHAGLHAYAKQQLKAEVILPKALFSIVGNAILNKLDRLQYKTLALSVGPTHAHLLTQLPVNYKQAKQITGQLKQASSHAIRDYLPGRVWADGGKPIVIDDENHHQKTFEYILRHQNEGDWTWAYRQHPLAINWPGKNEDDKRNEVRCGDYE